jgi:hypothetical protein
MDDLQERGNDLVRQIDGSLRQAYVALGFLAGMVVGSLVSFLSMYLVGALK